VFFQLSRTLMKTLFIDSSSELESLCAELAHHPFVTVDTEFVRERTYYPQLALIQLGNPEIIACVDPLAIDDLSPLKTLMHDPRVTKVFHAASQDMEIFHLCFKQLPKPVFDSQLAASVLGLGDQVGYANLVKEIINVDLDKSQSRTDWIQRPLDPKQITYAEDDVRYLTQIYPIMLEQLSELNRLSWLDDDFASLTDEQRYIPQPDQMWKKVKGMKKLKGVQLSILQAVTGWREHQAIEQDIPRRRVIGDELLLDMAKLRPKTVEALAKLRGINGGLVNRHGKALINLIEQAQQRPREEWPKQPKFIRLDAAQDAIVDALSAIVKLCAAQHKINANNLVCRKELEKLVCGERDLPILQGWRLRHGGQLLLDFIDGDGTLRIDKMSLKFDTANT